VKNKSNSRLIKQPIIVPKLAIFPSVLIQEMELIRKRVLLGKLFRRGF
jgi:hypothetical protein